MEDKLPVLEENEEEAIEDQKELIHQRIEDLKLSNAALLAENDMFEGVLGRLDPQDLEPQAGGDGAGQTGGSLLEGGGGGRRRRSRFNISDRLLSLEQKLFLAKKEVTETRHDQEELSRRYDIIKDNYKASLEEADLRQANIRKAKNEIEHKLLKWRKDGRLEMKEPEKVLRHIEDKSKVSQLKMYTLKNQALKAQDKKLLQHLQQKKEMKKSDYEEIFQEFTEPIVEKNLEELQIKSLKAQRLLSSHKEKLQTVTHESEELNKDIDKKRQMLEKIEEKIQHAEEARIQAEALNKHLRRQLEDYEAPDFMEYLEIKDKHKKLLQSVHTWERKVEIAELALKTHSKVPHFSKPSRSTALTPVNSAETGLRSKERHIPVKLPHIAEQNT